MSDLRHALEGFPGIRRITATKQDVRDTLLSSDGRMLLAGQDWDIKTRHIGAGIYEVWLAPTRYGREDRR